MISKEKLYFQESDCCGCGSCVDVCPNSVLTMETDKSGFYYPIVTNQKLCVDCNLCLDVCPLKSYQTIHSGFTDYYAGYIKDEKELISCASGGLATSISKSFIKSGGLVYGCAYSENWRSIDYIRVSDELGINRLKKSKYSQSLKKDIYKQILGDLESGKKVLFIGLPCDVFAVRLRIPEMFNNNLFLVELICHGPTSQKAYHQYLSSLYPNDEIAYFSSREKKNGKWTPFYNYIQTKSGKTKYEQFHNSPYGSAFKYLKRPSCYTCPIKGEHLSGDLMIGDYHYVEKGMRGYNEHGVSSALVHNEKGLSLLKSLNSEDFNLVKISKSGALGNAAITKAIPSPEGQFEYRMVFERDGLIKASKLSFVIIDKLKSRLYKSIMNYGVQIKRLVFPFSKPQ